MKKTIFVMPLLLASCATMNDSLKLGASMGALGGAAATYAVQSGGGNSTSFENVALGAGIGMGIGLLTSYITHKQVEEDRQSYFSERTEMHFGDLPPSPFIMPNPSKKKGGR